MWAGMRGSEAPWVLQRSSGSTFSQPGSRTPVHSGGWEIRIWWSAARNLDWDESALGSPRLTFLAFFPPMGAIFVVSGLKLGTDVDLRGLCVPLRSPELPRGCSRALYTRCSGVGWCLQPPHGPTAGLGQGTRPPAFY